MEESITPRAVLPAIMVSGILFAGVFMAFQSSTSHPSTIVLPGGITYLGPTPTAQPKENSGQMIDGKIPVSRETPWAKRSGTIFPYSFSYPETLSLGVFPDDPYEAVTVFYPGTDANANIFFRVEDLTKLNQKQYIGKPMEYAGIWWKNYAWKNVASVSAFTNSQGLKGYRATYINEQGNTPYDHVFFEVPENPSLVLWISGKILTDETFDRMVDSVAWMP